MWLQKIDKQLAKGCDNAIKCVEFIAGGGLTLKSLEMSRVTFYAVFKSPKGRMGESLGRQIFSIYKSTLLIISIIMISYLILKYLTQVHLEPR